MRLPRRVPWTSIAELDQVCSWIFTDETDLDSKSLATNRLAAWKAITQLPHALESTHSLLVVIVQDAKNEGSSSYLSLRQSYASAIIRLVNGLVDPLQLGVYARSIAAIASQLDLPLWLVELRHAATHEDLPSLELLREAARQSMAWLLHNYWIPTINPTAAPQPDAHLHPLSPILKQYKELLKLTTRDASLKSHYKQSISQVLKEIEKWIAEAKVAANVVTGELGWNTGYTTEAAGTDERDAKERWALEIFCDALLEKGGLVPLSKKTLPTDSSEPPSGAVQVWTPLLNHIQSLHPDFFPILVSKMIHRLTADAKTTGSEAVKDYDSSYASCLSRWMLWAIHTAEAEDPDDALRLETSATLITAVRPGTQYSPSSRKMFEDLLRDLCSEIPDLQDALATLRPFDTVSVEDWTTEDISVMEDRLNALLSITSSVPEAELEDDLISGTPLKTGSGDAPGWHLLGEGSGWKPCPIDSAATLDIQKLEVAGAPSYISSEPPYPLNLTHSMKFNTPLPQPLPRECDKAAKIFRSFVDRGNNGLDGVIPREVLENAKGFAIFTIVKAGFVFSARAGSGIVIARLPNGGKSTSWSAPSAIGTAGLGFGGQAGAEMTDFLVVLNSRSALRSFMAAGSLTLGGNASIAVGPLGRNGEATGSLNTKGKLAAMYSYSKTKGLFGGISIEGSVIVERQDANVQAYHNDTVTVQQLLTGVIEPPVWASGLINTLESCMGAPGPKTWVEEQMTDGGYAFDGIGSPGSVASTRKLKKGDKSPYPPPSWGTPKNSGGYFDDPPPADNSWQGGDTSATYGFSTRFEQDFAPSQAAPKHKRLQSAHYPSASNPFETSSTAHNRSKSLSSARGSFSSSSDPFGGLSDSKVASPDGATPPPYIAPKPELAEPLQGGVARAIALYDFQGVETGDLSFVKGDVITIIQKSDSTDDWWTGKVRDMKGIFPANFVEVV
ncbi:rRNA-processing protein las1 [Marasmius crinis-equi]|uniref:rRNA-processing protein las1 n=1 Tax=Marasmius crinis-equi TaxID=585013 RepID=A0ABR3FMM3_9AGAR